MPTGAVTFLFTDIEGSTRLVKHLRESYGDVLDEHQRLLREAFQAHRGYEVDTQGDSFFVAFSSARDALLAAVEGQLALLNHPWPDGVHIKVRMGLHTGQAVVAGGRYTGLAVHRAARIGATGHGGQILVSQATQTLVEDEEEDLHIHLQDLGEQRVKDLDRPVRLYQANSDGLPAEFAPLRPPPAAPVPLWRRPAVLGAAAVALVLIVVATAGFALNNDPASVAVEPNSVAVVDPENGRVIDDIQGVGTRPEPITHGDGSIWVGNLDDKSVSRIDIDRRQVVRGGIPLGGRTPTGLAYGFGALWVAHGRNPTGGVSRIDPQFYGVSGPIEVGGTAFGSTNGSLDIDKDSVWVVFGDSTLARIDPVSQRVVEQTRAGQRPAGIVAGSGSLWVTNSGEADVWRYNPAAFAERIGEVTVGSKPTGIAYGEGAVWVANTADDSVNRINTDLGRVAALIPVGDGPSAVAVGAGSVWVVNREDGTLSRINPDTNKVEGKVEIGNEPSGIDFADGLLWVTVQAP